MANSVWVLHENLERVNNPIHAYGADRADLVQDLGLTGNYNKHDALDAFLAWLPSTLSGVDIAILEPLYTLAETSRSTIEGLEYIIYPSAISLVDAETMISPQKV